MNTDALNTVDLTTAGKSKPLRNNSIRAGFIITQRDLAHWTRDPWTPVFGLLFSVTLLLIFGYLFGGAIEIPGVGESDRADYIDYLVPGMLSLTMMFGVEATTAAMATDAKRGITDRFRSMPIPASAVSLGRVGADMINSVVELGVLIIGGLLIGWTIDSDPLSAMRVLFGNPTGVTQGPLDNWALLLAIAWPAAISLVFMVLSARAYRTLRR